MPEAVDGQMAMKREMSGWVGISECVHAQVQVPSNWSRWSDGSLQQQIGLLGAISGAPLKWTSKEGLVWSDGFACDRRFVVVDAPMYGDHGGMDPADPESQASAWWTSTTSVAHRLFSYDAVELRGIDGAQRYANLTVDDRCAYDLCLSGLFSGQSEGWPALAIADGVVASCRSERSRVDQSPPGSVNPVPFLDDRRRADYGAVLIDHGNGLWSSTLHLKDIQVRPGDRVRSGSVIGLVGKTSPHRAFPHLHIAVYRSVITGGEAERHMLLESQPVGFKTREFAFVVNGSRVEKFARLDVLKGASIQMRVALDMRPASLLTWCVPSERMNWFPADENARSLIQIGTDGLLTGIRRGNGWFRLAACGQSIPIFVSVN
jgi:hypothetical protein